VEIKNKALTSLLVLRYSCGIRHFRDSLCLHQHTFSWWICAKISFWSHTDEDYCLLGQIPGIGSPTWLNFVHWHLVFSVNAWWIHSPPHKKCVSVHMHHAESAWKQWGSGCTPELWVLSMELVSCHLSGAQNFEVAPRFFLENLRTQNVAMCSLGEM